MSKNVDWRKKARSLETMLSRARVQRDDALAVAIDAVNAVKEMRNGKDDEALKTFGRALERAEALKNGIREIAGAEAGEDANG